MKIKVIRKIASSTGFLKLKVSKLKCLNNVVPIMNAIISNMKFIPFFFSIIFLLGVVDC